MTHGNLSRRDFAATALCAIGSGLSTKAFAATTYGALTLDSKGRENFAGHTWGVQQATGKSYSIQEATSAPPLQHRFEVRSGDTWSKDRYVNRAEFQSLTKHPFGEDVWFSYAMRIKAGAPVTKWNVLGQFHNTPDAGEPGLSPPFAINFIPGEKLRFLRRYNPYEVDSSPTVSTMLTKAVARDRWYRIVGRITFGWNDDGAVNIWMDGSKVIGLSNTNIGYNDEVGPYWKFGIYRAQVSETLAVEYANMELGSGSLLNRVTSPLPILG